MQYFRGPVYSTYRGTTYNSYLIVDEKITLVDTVYATFAGEMLERIMKVIDPAQIGSGSPNQSWFTIACGEHCYDGPFDCRGR